MRVRIVKPEALNSDLIDIWRGFLADDPALASPYFSPEFTRLVARGRDDVEVAVLEKAGEVIGFFPFQRRPGNVGKPVGGRLSDFQAIIGRAERCPSAAEVLRACDLKVWDFDHLLASQSIFHPHVVEGAPVACLDISHGWDAYKKHQFEIRTNLLHSSHRSFRRSFKEIKRKGRKLAREVGPVRFVMDVTDEDVLDQVIEWKSQQYRRTNVTDVFAREWTAELLRRILRHRTNEFSGLLSALYAGDRLVAAHMGMRSRTVFHCWFPAYDMSTRRCSPGNQLFLEMAKAAAEMGIKRFDLGKVADWKASFMNHTIPVVEGSVDLRPIRRRLRSAWRSSKAWLKASPLRNQLKVPGRLAYRLKEWMEFR